MDESGPTADQTVPIGITEPDLVGKAYKLGPEGRKFIGLQLLGCGTASRRMPWPIQLTANCSLWFCV